MVGGGAFVWKALPGRQSMNPGRFYGEVMFYHSERQHFCFLWFGEGCNYEKSFLYKISLGFYLGY